MSVPVLFSVFLGLALSAGPVLAQAQAADGTSAQQPVLTPPEAADAAAAPAAELVSTSTFRVCADPSNPPMSSKDEAGFENQIAELFGEALGKSVKYTWFPQSMGFVRKTLGAGLCDVIMGYAQGDELVQNTNHYYSSAYVLVTRSDSDLAGVTTLQDPALQGHRIGVVAGTPPTDHLRRVGLIHDALAYPLLVDRRIVDPVGMALDDLKGGRSDAAVLWGPLTGARVKDDSSLHMIPLLNEPGKPKLTYRITMGVRPSDQGFKRQLNSQIRRLQGEIDTILREAGVPLVNDRGNELKPEG